LRFEIAFNYLFREKCSSRLLYDLCPEYREKENMPLSSDYTEKKFYNHPIHFLFSTSLPPLFLVALLLFGE